MGNILLVHGACMSGACWDLVVPPLRERGHRVEAVDLHRGSLAADTMHAQQTVDTFDGSVLACGHSYGGMVVTGLSLPAASQLVYIAAFMPEQDETSGELTASLPADGGEVMSLDEQGNIVLGGAELDEVCWGGATSEQAAVGRAARRPQALSVAYESAGRIGWRDTPSTYVVCRQDRAVHPELQREMAKRATSVIEWDSSHSPNVAHPELVIELLDRLAGPRPGT